MRFVGAAGIAPMATGVATAAVPSGGSGTRWTTGEKYGVGTVADHRSNNPSRVWFTLTEGALTEVRFPRIDLLNVRTLDFAVTDADAGYAERSYNEDRMDDENETIERSVELVDEEALLFRHEIRETASDRDWTLTTEYVGVPGRDALLADVEFKADDERSYDVYAILNTAMSQSGTADVAAVRGGDGTGYSKAGPALTATDTEANDDSAVILDEDGNAYNTALSMVSDRGFGWATVDVVGGDSLSPLLGAGEERTTYNEAEGNVALVGRLGVDTSSVTDTVSIGFAENRDVDAATKTACEALRPGYGRSRASYRNSWREYLKGIDVPEDVLEGDLRTQYNVAAMELRAADSKQYPGAGIASPSVPWGDYVNADEPSDYGYNYVWSRDLYQAFTAMLAMGEVESALDAVEYLYEFQQRENGFLPQNTFVDGRTRWGGEQMDNISFPQVMAYQLKEREGIGFEDAGYSYENVRLSAEYVVMNGPATGQERWEEESGYSPSTTAAEIAGLACAASLAADEGEWTDALVFLAIADHWQSKTEEWLATTEPPANDPENVGEDYAYDYADAPTPYYLRINDDRDPNDGATVKLNNGEIPIDERAVIDASFLELVRLGVKPWDDEVIRNSLSIVDETIRVETPHGPAWYRYTEDGYGEQGEDPNDSLPEGAPWGAEFTPDGEPLDEPDMAGRGRLWPIFDGERGEYALLADDESDHDPANLLRTMHGFANSGYMIPEQVWDQPEPTEYGWEFGEGTGSATPLSWSMAQFIRLSWGIVAGEPVETPAFVRNRYVEGDVPEGPELSVDFPKDAAQGKTATVSGTTNGRIVIVKTDAETVQTEPTDGSFEVDLPNDNSEIVVIAATDRDHLTDVGTAVRTA